MVKGEFSGQILRRAGAGSKIYDFEGMTGEWTLYDDPQKLPGVDSMQRRGGNSKAGSRGPTGESVRRW